MSAPNVMRSVAALNCASISVANLSSSGHDVSSSSAPPYRYRSPSSIGMFACIEITDSIIVNPTALNPYWIDN